MHATLTDSHATASRKLIVVVVIAAAFRISWASFQPTSAAGISQLPDQQEYLSLAKNLLSGQGLALFDERFHDWVYAFRMPGYPMFVAALGADVRLIRLIQAILDTSTVLAIYFIARRWLPPRTSRMAAALVALNPFLIYFSGLILSETLFTCLLAWGMCFLVWPGKQSAYGDVFARGPTRSRHMLLGGFLLGLSILVRQSAAPLPIVLGIAAAFVNRSAPGEHQKSRWPLPVATTMLLLTVLVLAPWGYRNKRVMGQWIVTTTNGGITAYDGFNPGATGASDQLFLKTMPELSRMGEIGRDEHLRRLATQYAKEHPGRSAALAGIKMARTWSPIPLSDTYRQWKYWILGVCFSVPFDVLVIAGLIIKRRDGGLPRSAKVFLLLPAVYFTCVHALSVGSLRYRIPVEPPMAVVGAVGLALVLRPRQRLQAVQP